MPRNPDDPLTFRSLYESAVVGLRDYHCRAERGGPAAEEESGANHVVLMRLGAFCKHFGRRSVTADVNQAVFFSEGSTYRVSHPADCGDRGTIFAPPPHVLNDIVRAFDPSVDDRPDRPFAFVTGPCDAAVYARHHELVRRLESPTADPPDPLWVDETALSVVAAVLGSAFARLNLPRRRRHRAGTEADHAGRVEAAKMFLAERLGGRVTLDDVARSVHASPFHFARLFAQRTGLPVHRYLTLLRLRAALERLADGADDLTALALDLGFSSHGHFTAAFRREFGRTPSAVRRDSGPRALRELGKNLKV